MRLFDLILRDSAQERHPILHRALDHDHSVFLKLLDLLWVDRQALRGLASHDPSRQRYVRCLDADAQLRQVQGLPSNGLVRHGDAPDAVKCHRSASNGQRHVVGSDHLFHPLNESEGLHIVREANSTSSHQVLGDHACKRKHREAAILHLLVLLLGKLLDRHVPAHLPAIGHGASSQTQVSGNGILVHEQPVSAESFQQCHHLDQLPGRGREGLL
mmetsp:Transcript_39251/g.73214  ORF Transcript_39251/g.73214 Transcript_39251/m.73214 type:complete len:215 (+) Transcript_39251:828-1472(+)